MEAHMVFLILHVACGSVALLTAAMAFMTEKGPRFHAKVGRVFGLLSGGLAILQKRLTNGGTGPRGKLRIQMHTLYMESGTIATVTAFVVTALDGGVFAWLMPTVVGTALLTWNLRGVRLGSIASAQTTV